MTPDDTRNWVRQEDDGWTRAMELALTPIVAGGIGYVCDRILGTVPVITIVFFVLAVIGTFIKMFYAYDTKMKEHEAESPWGRARSRAAERLVASRAATSDKAATVASRAATTVAASKSTAAAESSAAESSAARSSAATRAPTPTAADTQAQARSATAAPAPARRTAAPRNAAADHAAADRAAIEQAIRP